MNLPNEVVKHLESLKKIQDRLEFLKKDIPVKTEALRNHSDALRELHRTQWRDKNRINAMEATHDRMKTDLANAEDEKKRLNQNRKRLEAMTAAQTTILASETSQNYGGVKVWQATGMAPVAEKGRKKKGKG